MQDCLRYALINMWQSTRKCSVEYTRRQLPENISLDKVSVLKLSVSTLATVISDENLELTISVLKCNFAVLKNFENCALPKVLISDDVFLTRDVW